MIYIRICFCSVSNWIVWLYLDGNGSFGNGNANANENGSDGNDADDDEW